MKIPGKFLAVLALGAATMSSAARAQGSAPIYVSFHFDARAAEDFETPAQQTAAENEISRTLARVFQGKLGLWTFTPLDAPDRFPRFDIILSGQSAWTVIAEFRAERAGPPERDWNATLFEPGEFKNNLSRLLAAGWGPLVEQKVTEKLLLTGIVKQMLGVLQEKAPLGYAVRLPIPPFDADKPKVILPLAWKDYQMLGDAIFTIRCESEDGLVYLHSEGIGQSESGKANQPAFPGILVLLKEWEVFHKAPTPISEHLSALGSLRPKEFYLKQRDRSWSSAAP